MIESLKIDGRSRRILGISALPSGWTAEWPLPIAWHLSLVLAVALDRVDINTRLAYDISNYSRESNIDGGLHHFSVL